MREKADAQFLAWTPGTDFGARAAVKDTGFDGCFSSMAWWDFDERWFIEEHRVQKELGWQVAFPEPPFARRIAHGTESREILERRAIRALRLAASLGGGLMVPMGFEYGAVTPLDPTHGNGAGLRRMRHDLAFDISSEIRLANTEVGKKPHAPTSSLRLIRNANGPVSALLQAEAEDLRSTENVRFILLNRDLRKSAPAPVTALREAASGFLPAAADGTALRLRAGETLVVEGKALKRRSHPGRSSTSHRR